MHEHRKPQERAQCHANSDMWRTDHEAHPLIGHQVIYSKNTGSLSVGRITGWRLESSDDLNKELWRAEDENACETQLSKHEVINATAAFYAAQQRLQKRQAH